MNVVLIVIFVLLAVGLSVYALRPGLKRSIGQSRSDIARLEFQEERDAIYKHVHELEYEHQQALIDDTDYARLRLRDETRAALILEKLLDLPPVKLDAVVLKPIWLTALAVLAALIVMIVMVNTFFAPSLQVLALRPGEAEIYAQGRALNVLESKLDAEATLDSKGPSVKTLLQYGQIAWDLKDYERAAPVYSSVLRREPSNTTAIRRYGMLLFFAGQNKPAQELLNASIRLETNLANNADAYMTLGNIFFAEKNPTGAIGAWRKYLAVVPASETGRIPDLIASAQKQLGASNSGELLFAQNCASCHGANAQGLVGPNLKTSSNAKSVTFVRNQLKNGSKNTKMPAFLKFSATELTSLIAYVNRLK